MRVEQVDDGQFEDFARLSGHPLPIEQSPVWDAYDAAVEGREFWRRLAVWDGNHAGSADAGTPAAIIALTQYPGRGFQYLWAKHGPVWITEQTPERERALRDALREYVAREAPQIDFMRLHARHPGSDLHELLQTVTYDRTVIIDLTPDEDDILASFTKRRRSGIRKALKDEAFEFSDESGLSREEFAELYSIYEETASRDEFGIYQADVYYTMIEALGEHARVFVTRRVDAGTPEEPRQPGRAIAWVIVTVYDGAAVSYYAGANEEARQTDAVMAARWHVIRTLKAEGVATYDLMGVDSPRAPTLTGVGYFKRQFAPDVEVDGAWDVAVKRGKYLALKTLLAVKRALRR
jgi:hypothetical protein